MAFPLPGGMVATPYGEAADDPAVAAIEGQQPAATRMLVALVFPFHWPGFGWTADQADGAARSIAGLSPWPELGRVVIPDPDGEPVWWVAYTSSPAWWLAIMGVLAAIIAAAITVRVVWVVTPEEVRGGLGGALNILPLMVVGMAFMMIMPMMREMVPPVVEKVKGKLPGG